MREVIGAIAETICSSAVDAVSQLALQTTLSQMTHFLKHEAAGTSL